LVKKLDLIKILIDNFHYNLVVPNTDYALLNCAGISGIAAISHLSIL